MFLVPGPWVLLDTDSLICFLSAGSWVPGSTRVSGRWFLCAGSCPVIPGGCFLSAGFGLQCQGVLCLLVRELMRPLAAQRRLQQRHSSDDEALAIFSL